MVKRCECNADRDDCCIGNVLFGGLNLVIGRLPEPRGSRVVSWMLVVMLGAEDLGSLWRKPNIATPMAMTIRQVVVKG
ncbi:MAG: hypothetical protein CNF01_08930 [Halieaceae bacterium MED-G27]|nr:hypothetical protein [Halieaceae bacterium]OUT64651.1 MAG: hypothetical protein CBB81_08825 [Cellvibrionales bacterium TMED21]PDH33712.1 MAG: hypothetical protein CNF01_08930 [Halieaceae bacterium MED-G27]